MNPAPGAACRPEFPGVAALPILQIGRVPGHCGGGFARIRDRADDDVAFLAVGGQGQLYRLAPGRGKDAVVYSSPGLTVGRGGGEWFAELRADRQPAPRTVCHLDEALPPRSAECSRVGPVPGDAVGGRPGRRPPVAAAHGDRTSCARENVPYGAFEIGSPGNSPQVEFGQTAGAVRHGQIGVLIGASGKGAAEHDGRAGGGKSQWGAARVIGELSDSLPGGTLIALIARRPATRPGGQHGNASVVDRHPLKGNSGAGRCLDTAVRLPVITGGRPENDAGAQVAFFSFAQGNEPGATGAEVKGTEGAFGARRFERGPRSTAVR